MATLAIPPEIRRAPGARLVARWIPTTDERGRRRLVMEWHVPDVSAERLSAVGDPR